MSILGGAALGAGAAGLGIMALDPYIRKSIATEVQMNLSPRKAREQSLEESFRPPQESVDRAQALAEYLRGKMKAPESTIAISGVGGAGKSTAAKLLSQDLGMALSGELSPGTGRHPNKVLSGRGYAKLISKAEKIKPGTIYEGVHLLSMADPDKFNAMVYLNRDPKAIEKSLIQRGRGASMKRLVDYPLLDRVARHSFENAMGEETSPSPGVRVKIRPEGGYRSEERLQESLRAGGFSDDQISKMDREAMLYALAGKPGRTNSMLSQAISPAYDARSVAAIAAILGGGALGGALLGAGR